MTAWLVIALATLALVEHPPGTTLTEVEVVPVTEAVAVEMLEQTCMIGLDDVEQLGRAAESSEWAFRAQPPTMNGLRLNWSSRYGFLSHIGAHPALPGLPLPQCNLSVFTRGPVNGDALQDEVSAMLLRRVGTAPEIHVTPGGVSWGWVSGGRQLKLHRIRLLPDQIELSLQSGGAYR